MAIKRHIPEQIIFKSRFPLQISVNSNLEEVSINSDDFELMCAYTRKQPIADDVLMYIFKTMPSGP